MGETRKGRGTEAPVGRTDPWLVVALALVLPGAGHAWLGRRGRGAIFFTLVIFSLLVGCSLDGDLDRIARELPLVGQPLAVLTTLATMSSGLPYVTARWIVGHAGDAGAPGYEYGNAFVVTAGLMNLLLLLDVWDIAHGRKD